MSAGAWAVTLVLGLPMLAASVVFVAGVVVAVRDRRARPVVPWVGRGNLDQLHPTRAVVMAWAQGPAGGERDVWDDAHRAVRAAMPQLATQLDRMVMDARRHAEVGVAAPVGPCAYGAHVWALAGPGVAECARCGSLEGVDGPSRNG